MKASVIRFQFSDGDAEMILFGKPDDECKAWLYRLSEAGYFPDTYWVPVCRTVDAGPEWIVSMFLDAGGTFEHEDEFPLPEYRALIVSDSTLDNLKDGKA